MVRVAYCSTAYGQTYADQQCGRRPRKPYDALPRVHSIIEGFNFRTGVVRNDAYQTLQVIGSPPQTASEQCRSARQVDSESFSQHRLRYSFGGARPSESACEHTAIERSG